MTSSTHTLIAALEARATDSSLPRPTNLDLMDAAERMKTMQRLLDRAADIIAYPIGSSGCDKWLADAKVIGIEPCPF